MNKIKITSFMLLITILLTACQDPEKNKLDNRALDFWKAKINKDFKTAYQFLSPGWKSSENEDSYVRRLESSRVNWVGVKLSKKSCSQSDVCTVTMIVDYEYLMTGSFSKNIKMSTQIKGNWIMKDNVWFNVPNETKIK